MHGGYTKPFILAFWAASIPLGESSKTKQSSGDIFNNWAAFKNNIIKKACRFLQFF